jgi:outer membrane protein OmpA-like peptidoglycan-associated protein
MHRAITLGLTITILLGGCAKKSGTGALIGGGAGGAAGAGIGALAAGKKGAVIGGLAGAAVGAGTGALIGHYMDKQEEELKKVKAANVERKGDELVVKFASAILFDTGKSELKPQSKTDLTEFAGVLKKYPDTNLVIEGHTDSTGSVATNEKLSAARAQAVVDFLASQGVVGMRMQGKGFASTMPVGDNATDAGRQQNRRVEVKIAANEELKKKDAEAAAAAEQQQQPAPAPAPAPVPK